MKKFILFIILAQSALVYADEDYQKRIIGKWLITEFDKKDMLRQFIINHYLPDGKCLLEFNGKIVGRYKWEISDKTLTIVEDKSKRVFIYDIDLLNENRLVFISREKGIIIDHERIINFNLKHLAGRWQIIEIVYENSQDLKITEMSYLSLTENNTFIATQNKNREDKGIWRVAGNYIILEYKDIKKTGYLKIKHLSDSKMILYDIEDNYSITLHKL